MFQAADVDHKESITTENFTDVSSRGSSGVIDSIILLAVCLASLPPHSDVAESAHDGLPAAGGHR